jgi:hypothetical protein
VLVRSMRSLKEIKRELARFDDTVQARYEAAFPNEPLPHMYWHGELADLERLMEQAMEDGLPLTAEDLMRAQGSKMPPPETCV